MAERNIPFGEPVSFELINSKDQDFILWAEPSNGYYENLQALNNRKKIYQPLLLCIPSGQHNIVIKHQFRFPVEVLYINEFGQVFKIQNLSSNSIPSEIIFYSAIEVLITPVDFCKVFSIREGNSFIKKISSPKVDVINPKPVDIEKDDLTSDKIVEFVLNDKPGKGLRSSMPSLYVWYHDLLFFINKTAFPGYAASKPMNNKVKNAINILKSKDVCPILRDTAYPRVYLNILKDVKPIDTWWGMENIGKFIQNNWVE